VTRVDFYLLPDVDTDARHRFVCRLAQKAVRDGRRVYLEAEDDAHGRWLDRLLWEYPDAQFLPHALAPDPDAARAPVVIGFGQPPDIDQMLINLSRGIPAWFGRFERVAEIVIEPQRGEGRERYRQYREKGHQLFHHDLEDWEDK